MLASVDMPESAGENIFKGEGVLNEINYNNK